MRGGCRDRARPRVAGAPQPTWQRHPEPLRYRHHDLLQSTRRPRAHAVWRRWRGALGSTLAPRGGFCPPDLVRQADRRRGARLARRTLFPLDDYRQTARAVDGNLQQGRRRLAHELSRRVAGCIAAESLDGIGSAGRDSDVVFPDGGRRLGPPAPAMGDGDRPVTYSNEMTDGPVR